MAPASKPWHRCRDLTVILPYRSTFRMDSYERMLVDLATDSGHWGGMLLSSLWFLVSHRSIELLEFSKATMHSDSGLPMNSFSLMEFSLSLFTVPSING